MKPHIMTLALVMLSTGCGGGSSGSALGSAPPAPVAATPSPTPTVTPTATPTPDPTPSPTPTPTPASYLPFADIYIFSGRAAVTLQSACGGFAFQGQPPAVLAASAFGQGLAFRYVQTPGVWAISGEVAVGFDGRDGQILTPGVELSLAKPGGPDAPRFSIARPTVGAAGSDYVRLASVSAPVQGVGRLYQCVIGVPTLAADLATSPSGVFARTVLLATAFVRDGSTSRAYSLTRSTVSISADLPARRVAISLGLVGTPTDGAGPDVALGTFAASAPIDPATGNFVAPLTSSARPVTGTISGRFFGPQAVEIGVAFGASADAAGNAPALSFAGGVFGTR